MAARLRSHLELCRQLLDIAENEARVTHLDALEAENQARTRRETLLPKLVESLADLRLVRAAWQQFTAEERASQPEILSLLRENQDLIMQTVQEAAVYQRKDNRSKDAARLELLKEKGMQIEENPDVQAFRKRVDSWIFVEIHVF